MPLKNKHKKRKDKYRRMTIAMKKILSFLLALSFIVSVFPFSAAAHTVTGEDALAIDLCIITETGEYEESENHTVYGMISEGAFDENALSALTRYLESVSKDKTVFIVTNGALTEEYRNVMVLLHILDMHSNCVLVSCGEGFENSVTRPGEHIHYFGASYVIDFTYVTLSDDECTLNAHITDGEVTVDVDAHDYEHDVHDHVHMYDDGDGEAVCTHANISVVGKVDPTCTSAGYSGDVFCNDCQTVVTKGNAIPEAEHNFKLSRTKNPDCLSNGYKDYECTECGEIEREILYSTGSEHTWGSEYVSKEAKCGVKGEMTKECSTCHMTETRDIPALEHDIKTTTVAATCTSEGYTLKKCNRAGCTYEEKTNIVPQKTHSYKIVKTKNPDCLSNGYKDYECDNCGDFYRETLYSTGTEHVWGSEYVSKEAKCGVKGEMTTECSVCHMTETRDIPALEHIIKITVVAATCTQDGYTLHKCERSGCTYEEKTNIVSKTGHDYKLQETKAPDCTTDGYNSYKCANCGDVKKEAILSTGTEHKWGSEYVSKEAKCGVKGEMTKECSVCHIKDSRDIPALEHTMKSTVVASTCTKGGYTLHECTRSGCNYEFKDNETPLLGHKFDEWYTDAEYHAKKCTRCGTTDTKVPHDYSNGACVCGHGCEHVWGQWVSDANGHERSCTKCSETTGKSAHNYSNSKCTECGYACTHTWGDWQTVTASTCDKKGSQKRTCYSCDAVETKEISANGHKYDSVVTAPTCTEGGYTTHTCSVCGHSYKDAQTSARGHEFSGWVTITESTCTEKGSKRRTCLGCAMVETGVIDAKGHSYIETVTKPTCTEGGYTTYVCSECSHTYTGNTTPSTGHKFNDWIKDASSHTERCSVCGATGTKGSHTYTDGKCNVCKYECAHSGVTLKNASAATCTKEGYTGDKYCNTCGKTVEKGTVIPALPHDLSDWKHNGNEHYKICSVCSAQVDKGAHSYNGAMNCQVCGYGCSHGATEIRGKKDPTCSAFGYTGDTYCTVCSVKIKTGDNIPMLDHTWGNWEYSGVGGHFKPCTKCSAVTNTEPHTYKDGKCTACNYACSHVWGEWSTVKDSTCTEDGSKKRVCSICALEGTGTVPAKGHDYKAVVTKPTCTEKGYTTHTCSRCSVNYVDTQVNATGHSWGNWITVKDSTCLEKGTKKRICSVCSAEESGMIDEKGHNHVAKEIAPTCTEKGYTLYDCSRCEDEYKENYVDALGHSWGDWTVTKKPTLSKEGEMQRKCTRCNAVEKQAVPVSEDKTPPKATIVIGDHTWTTFKDSISFNTFYKDIVSVTITAQDAVGAGESDASGVLSIDYYQAVNVYTKAQLEKMTGWRPIKNIAQGGSFPIATDGEYIVYVRVTDNKGNTAYYSTDGFVIDRVMPNITGTGIDANTSNVTFCGSASITVTDDYLSKVYINGVSQEFTGKSCVINLDPSNTKYEIVVEDASGNGRGIVVSVGSEHVKGPAATCTDPQVCTVCGTVIRKATGHRWGSWTVTKTATAKEYGEETRQCSRCSEKETRQTPKLDFPTQFTSSVYTYSAADGLITGIAPQTTVESFFGNMDNSEYIKIFGVDTKEITDKTKVVTTGMKIKLMENATSYSAEATIIIKGDVNSDGKANTTDVVRTNFHCLGNGVTLVGAQLEAADFNGDGKVNITDVVQMNLTNLGII